MRETMYIINPIGTTEGRFNSLICHEKVTHPKSLHDRIDLIIKHFTFRDK